MKYRASSRAADLFVHGRQQVFGGRQLAKLDKYVSELIWTDVPVPYNRVGACVSVSRVVITILVPGPSEPTCGAWTASPRLDVVLELFW